tara:strand:+ start:1861 stop:2076 length:216 start_codon:yes stop_codon:yes gene_type:complete
VSGLIWKQGASQALTMKLYMDQAVVDGVIMKMIPEEKLNVLVEIIRKRILVLQWHDQVKAMMDTELTDTES